MTTQQGRELAKVTPSDVALLEKLVLEGDLSTLTPQERLSYYRKVCDTLNLAPFSRPFAFIRLSNKLTMYATAGAAEQIRANNNVSVSVTSRGEAIGGKVYMVVAKATTPDGRSDESIGVVNIEGKNGDDLANAMMKAETKAKRRVSMSICSLGFLDPPEISGVGDARVVDVDPMTGAMPGEEHRVHKVADEQPVAPAKPEPSGFACRTCGYRPMLESKFKKGDWYHYTEGVDANTGKKKTHQQSEGVPSPADAPAQGPAATAGVVSPLAVAIYAAGAKADKDTLAVRADVSRVFGGKMPEQLTPEEAQRVITGYTKAAQAKQAQVPLDPPAGEG